MARNSIEPMEMARTTVVLSKHLFNQMTIHNRINGENQTEFLTRAIINQMENDGNLEIRKEMEELING